MAPINLSFVRSLFNLRQSPEAPSQQEDNPSDVRNRGTMTYQEWGTRWAGFTDGSITALTPALHTVVIDQKRAQRGDEQIMANLRARLEAELRNIMLRIDDLSRRINDREDSIAAHREQKEHNNRQIEELRNGRGRSAISKVYFWISTVIVTLLGLYLFNFYSSASYSAFFGADTTSVAGAILNPHALQLALDKGLMTLLLVLLMPMIFIGLGFLIHIYAKKQGLVKYLKVLVLYVITFVFDALLAYQISKEFFVQTMDNPVYSLSQAANSPNFWIVIFSGFIAYVIWGLVFDSTMDAYEDMTANSRQIKELQKQNAKIDREIEKLRADNEADHNKQIELESEKNTREASLANRYVYNVDRIILELNNFFTGWIAYMTAMNRSQRDLDEARAALNAVVAAVDEDRTSVATQTDSHQDSKTNNTD